MPPKKTEAHYHALAAKSGFKWVGGEIPGGVNVKTDWLCLQGHVWQTRYSVIYRGFGCPYCSGNAPKTSNDYIALAVERGFEWLDTEPPQNTSATTVWRCGAGHEWSARYDDLLRGHNCPHCAKRAPKIAADYYALAELRGFKWLDDTLPANTHEKATWSCAVGHIWSSPYHGVQSGKGCPICAGRTPKTSDDYHALATKYGFYWLGISAPTSTNGKTLWSCVHRHVWRSSYYDIDGKHGCPYCAGLVPKKTSDYHALAAERGLEWLGEKAPPNSKFKTDWRCPQGHIWHTRYDNVRRYGCPQCANLVNGCAVSKPQIELCEMLGGELNYRAGNYVLDVALVFDDAKLAIEYDCWHWHRDKIEYDAKRDQELIALGWRVLRIKTNTKFPSEAQLDEAIARLILGEVYVELILPGWGS